MIIVPRGIHPYVQTLCQKIIAEENPWWVPVKPEFGVQENECFLNVANRVKNEGGKIQHGWCIWERPGFFVEGEFHSIWISPSGEELDITPKADEEEKILFLPDHNRIFDEEKFERIDNIRMAVNKHPIVQKFLDTMAEYNAWKESCSDPNNPQLMNPDSAKVMAYEQKVALLEMQMLELPVGRNDICRCGSGKKDKKCCMKSG